LNVHYYLNFGVNKIKKKSEVSFIQQGHKLIKSDIYKVTHLL